MPGAPLQERRRFPRARISSHAVTMVATSHVRILDLNSRAVLLACLPDMSTPAPGEHATLRVVLGAFPFSAEIVVRRVEPVVVDGVTTLTHVAATFVGLTPTNRLAVEHFLGKAVTT